MFVPISRSLPPGTGANLKEILTCHTDLEYCIKNPSVDAHWNNGFLRFYDILAAKRLFFRFIFLLSQHFCPQSLVFFFYAYGLKCKEQDKAYHCRKQIKHKINRHMS